MNGEAVALAEGGHQQRLRVVDQALEPGSREPVHFEHVVAKRRATLDEVDDRIVVPAARADQHELGCRRPEPPRQRAPGGEDHQVVLARLDRRAEHEERMPGEIRLDDAGRREGRRDRGGAHEDRKIAAPQTRHVGREVRGDRARRDHRRRGEPRHVPHPGLVAFELGHAKIFGQGDRQQIVDEEHRSHVAPLLEPGEARGDPERELTHVDVDAVLGKMRARRPGERQAVASGPIADRADGKRQAEPGAFAVRRAQRDLLAGDPGLDVLVDRVGIDIAAGFAPMPGDTVDRLGRGAPLQQSCPDAGRRRTEGVIRGAGEKMLSQGVIDAIDAVGRRVQNARQETRDVIANGAPHGRPLAVA